MSMSVLVSSNKFIRTETHIDGQDKQDEKRRAFGFEISNCFIVPILSIHVNSFPRYRPADVRQQLRGGALEEGCVEEADGLGGVLLLDDEGQVDVRRALRDEQDVDVPDGRE